MRILILEDDVLIGLDLSQMIEEQGHIVVGPFTSAAPAIAACERETPDVALLDFNLNGMTSEGAADRLIALNVPFVFVSGHARNHLPARFASTELLSKPISAEALAQAISSIGS